MDELIAKIADILEEDTIDLNKRFDDYEGWDSLSALTLIAIMDSEYHKTFTNQEIMSYPTIGDFCKAVV